MYPFLLPLIVVLGFLSEKPKFFRAVVGEETSEQPENGEAYYIAWDDLEVKKNFRERLKITYFIPIVVSQIDSIPQHAKPINLCGLTGSRLIRNKHSPYLFR